MILEVEEMKPVETHALLARVSYGHLGCVRDGRPYVLPINYVYRDPHIYLYTTEGMKTEYIAANPEVCLQVEDVQDARHWQSVTVTGRADRLTDPAERARAMAFITDRNPALTPALSVMWNDAWGRGIAEVVYRITPFIVDGRRTVPEGETRGPRMRPAEPTT